MLISRVKKLDVFGVNIICLACNTAHLLYPELTKYTNIHFPSLINIVSQKASDFKYRRVGIMASPTTLKSKLYQNSLEKLGIFYYIPNSKTINYLESVIRAVIGGQKINQDTLYITGKRFINENNLDGLILGCTELPLVFPKNKFPTGQIIDCLDILADTLISYQK